MTFRAQGNTPLVIRLASILAKWKVFEITSRIGYPGTGLTGSILNSWGHLYWEIQPGICLGMLYFWTATCSMNMSRTGMASQKTN